MSPLPAPSPGVLVSPFLGGLVAFEPQASEVHILRGSAGMVWQACTEGFRADELAAEVAAASGADAAVVEADVVRFVAMLRDVGLVGRTDPSPAPPPVARPAVTGRYRSRALVVLDERVVVHADDRMLVERVEAGFGTTDDDPTVEYGLTREDDGSLRLEGRGTGHPLGRDDRLLAGLVGELNQLAAASTGLLALHAGAARTPSGEVVVLPAPSESGKSTLTATLLREGWDYLGDEAIGVRRGSLAAVPYPKPLSLRPHSREVLGLGPSADHVPVDVVVPGARAVTGDAGPVTAIVLPRFVAGAPLSIERLDADDAIAGVAENAFNLAGDGQVALDALVQMVESVPVHRLVHGGGPDLAGSVLGLLGERI